MKSLLTNLRVFLVLTLLTGVIYPLVVTAIGHLFFLEKAQGSLVRKGNETVGSELLAQGFSNPKYFWPRPSANKYDGLSSGATNQSISSTEWIKTVKEREAQGLVSEMRFASASGLDPDISLEAAQAQIQRISTARELNSNDKARLEILVHNSLQLRQAGIFGEERINVLKLNLALDEAIKGTP